MFETGTVDASLEEAHTTQFASLLLSIDPTFLYQLRSPPPMESYN